MVNPPAQPPVDIGPSGSALELALLQNQERLSRPQTPWESPAETLVPTPATENDHQLHVGKLPVTAETPKFLGRTAAIILILQICITSSSTSMTNGLTTIAIPRITTELALDSSLVYWPVLVYNLTGGALLLIAGAISDVLGRRLIYLAGLFFVGIFGIACGLAQNGAELIAFRAIGGIALSFVLPGTQSLISTHVAPGQLRSIGFASVGIGMTAGYGTGMIVGGVLVDTIGWRTGYWIIGALQLVVLALSFWLLPPDYQNEGLKSGLRKLRTDIDWVGGALTSAALALLSYVLAHISSSSTNIFQPHVIALLTIGLLLVPICPLWFHYRTRRGQSALIPNSVWTNLPFTTISVMALLAFGEMASMELLDSLFFQHVQKLSAIHSAIRFIPDFVSALIMCYIAGRLMHKVPLVFFVATATIIGAGSPLLMAVIDPAWPYWYTAFASQVLLHFCVCFLQPAGMLIVSETFPSDDQGLAGGVLSTVGQLGQSLGLALTGVITDTVSNNSSDDDESQSLSTLMKGYRAGFWACFGWMLAACVIGIYGLRPAGKVGLGRRWSRRLSTSEHEPLEEYVIVPENRTTAVHG